MILSPLREAEDQSQGGSRLNPFWGVPGRTHSCLSLAPDGSRHPLACGCITPASPLSAHNLHEVSLCLCLLSATACLCTGELTGAVDSYRVCPLLAGFCPWACWGSFMFKCVWEIFIFAYLIALNGPTVCLYALSVPLVAMHVGCFSLSLAERITF